jgi:hypothetical protein
VQDPEAKLRSYGAFFGKTFKLPAWLDEVPRVRVRTISQRAQNDLVDLVVLNERLHGEINPWEARSRLELLRKKRKNWEHIYNYVTKADAAATLALIEEANEQVCAVAERCLWLRQDPFLIYLQPESDAWAVCSCSCALHTASSAQMQLLGPLQSVSPRVTPAQHMSPVTNNHFFLLSQCPPSPTG